MLNTIILTQKKHSCINNAKRLAMEPQIREMTLGGSFCSGYNTRIDYSTIPEERR